MCGFASYIQTSKDDRGLSRLDEWLEHGVPTLEKRGPDTKQSIQGLGFRLFHARLRIIDTSSASDQPMSKNKQHLIFNGEIYNFKELGYRLFSKEFNSDTAFLFEFLSSFGISKLKELRGMFSFLFFDENNNSILCARDPFGQKPFFYHFTNSGTLLVSQSEIHLAEYCGFDLNPDGLLQYEHFQLTFAGTTLFRNVKELPPGFLLKLEGGELVEERYWFPDFGNRALKENDIEHGRQLLIQAVQRCLVSDVPVALILSGGVDSSVVSGIASALVPNLKTFHGVFKEHSQVSEVNYARIQSGQNNCELDEIELSISQFIDDLIPTLECLETPSSGMGSVNQYAVARRISKTHKVVLGGQGGDEVFMGYARYFLKNQSSSGQAVLDGYEGLKRLNIQGLSDFRAYICTINRSSSEVPPSLEFMMRNFLRDSRVVVEEMSYMEIARAVDQLIVLPALLKVDDRTTMNFGLEGRIPLIDADLVRWANSISPEALSSNGPKSTLRAIAATYLHPKISDRKDKMGFPVPTDEIKTHLTQTSLYPKFAANSGNDRSFWGSFCISEFRQRISRFS